MEAGAAGKAKHLSRLDLGCADHPSPAFDGLEHESHFCSAEEGNLGHEQTARSGSYAGHAERCD